MLCVDARLEHSAQHSRSLQEEFSSDFASGLVADKWCRALGESLEDRHLVSFPHAIMELKLAGAEQPAWVDELLATGLLTPMPKFTDRI